MDEIGIKLDEWMKYLSKKYVSPMCVFSSIKLERPQTLE